MPKSINQTDAGSSLVPLTAHQHGSARLVRVADQDQAETPGRIISTLKQVMKSQLVDVVSAKTGRQKTEVEAIVESVFGAIAEALQANQRVDLRGFGSFVVKQKKERQGRNPRTGETISIAAKRDASFKAGKELNEKLVQPKAEVSPA